MIGVILGGGDSTRLRPLTNDKPKVMLKIKDKPVLEHNVNILKKAGILDIIITLYYKGEVITAHFKDGASFDVNITYSRQGKLLGTAGDVKQIKADFKASFIVIYGDNFSNCSLKPVLEYHKGARGIATIVLFDREKNPNSQIVGGCVRIDAKDNRVLEFIEGKGNITSYVNAGIYVLEKEILDYVPENTFYDFGNDLFPLLLDKGKNIYGYLMPENEYLFGIDTIDCYKRTNTFLEGRKTKL